MCAIMEHHLLNNIATLITHAQRQQFLVHSDACCVLTLMKAIVIRYIGGREGEALGRKGRSRGRGTTLLFRCQTNVMTNINSLHHSTVRSYPYPYPCPYNISLAVCFLSSRYRMMVNVSIQLHGSISAWICECVIFCVMYRLDLWSNGLSVFYAVKAVGIWSSIIYTLPLPSLTHSLSPLIPNLLAHHHACRASSSRITPISPSAINRLLTPASSLHRCAGWMPAVDGGTVLRLASSLLWSTSQCPVLFISCLHWAQALAHC